MTRLTEVKIYVERWWCYFNISLFSGTITNDLGEEIDEFQHFKDFFYDDINDEPLRLINEAYIEFLLIKASLMMMSLKEFIYNYEQNLALIDYFLDQSVSS